MEQVETKKLSLEYIKSLTKQELQKVLKDLPDDIESAFGEGIKVLFPRRNTSTRWLELDQNLKIEFSSSTGKIKYLEYYPGTPWLELKKDSYVELDKEGACYATGDTYFLDKEYSNNSITELMKPENLIPILENQMIENNSNIIPKLGMSTFELFLANALSHSFYKRSAFFDACRGDSENIENKDLLKFLPEKYYKKLLDIEPLPKDMFFDLCSKFIYDENPEIVEECKKYLLSQPNTLFNGR